MHFNPFPNLVHILLSILTSLLILNFILFLILILYHKSWSHSEEYIFQFPWLWPLIVAHHIRILFPATKLGSWFYVCLTLTSLTKVCLRLLREVTQLQSPISSLLFSLSFIIGVWPWFTQWPAWSSIEFLLDEPKSCAELRYNSWRMVTVCRALCMHARWPSTPATISYHQDQREILHDRLKYEFARKEVFRKFKLNGTDRRKTCISFSKRVKLNWRL